MKFQGPFFQMPILGGSLSLLNPQDRLLKLQSSAAYGGKHVPVPRSIRAVDLRPGGRIRTLADITSKLKNETVSSKLKKKK